MGNEEKDVEPAAPPKERESPEAGKESAVEPPQGQTSDATDPLNTYKWNTGSRGALNEPTEDRGASSSTPTLNKIQKASTNKWSKMQNWRKALSEDPGDRNSSSGKGGEGAKADKGGGATRKNPFRRALSEPPGSLFATRSPSSSTGSSVHTASPSAAAESPHVSSTDPSQRGSGGTLFKRYLRTVSQKLKRPRIHSRSSTPNLLPGTN